MLVGCGVFALGLIGWYANAIAWLPAAAVKLGVFKLIMLSGGGLLIAGARASRAERRLASGGGRTDAGQLERGPHDDPPQVR